MEGIIVSIYFMELYKLFKKKIVWILLIVSLLPFLYASAMYLIYLYKH